MQPIITYHRNGNINQIEYRENGVKHRVDGPAYIWFDAYGNKKLEEYFLNGINRSKKALRIITELGLDPDSKYWSNDDRERFASYFGLTT